MYLYTYIYFYYYFSPVFLRKECWSISLPESPRTQHSWKKWPCLKIKRFWPSYFRKARIRTSVNRVKICVESYTNTKLFPDKFYKINFWNGDTPFCIRRHCTEFDRPSWSQRMLFSVNVVGVSCGCTTEKSCSHRAPCVAARNSFIERWNLGNIAEVTLRNVLEYNNIIHLCIHRHTRWNYVCNFVTWDQYRSRSFLTIMVFSCMKRGFKSVVIDVNSSSFDW